MVGLEGFGGEVWASERRMDVVCVFPGPLRASGKE